MIIDNFFEIDDFFSHVRNAGNHRTLKPARLGVPNIKKYCIFSIRSKAISNVSEENRFKSKLHVASITVVVRLTR